MNESPRDIAPLLAAMAEGDTAAADELFPILYDQLHRMANALMTRERAGHTLQPTALVHEAWLKLVQPDRSSPTYRNRQHFLATAAMAMRQVLVNHAHARKTQKRGGSAHREPLPDIAIEFEQAAIDLLALDEALQRLAVLDARQARLVELRFFGGLTIDECARELNVSPRTVDLEWAHARAWLRGQLDGD